MVIQFFLRSFLSILKSGMIIYDAQRERNTRVFIALFDSFFSLEKSCIFPTQNKLKSAFSIDRNKRDRGRYIYIYISRTQTKEKEALFFLVR